MRTALAYKPEYDEVSVVSTEVLESNVAAMRGEHIRQRDKGDKSYDALNAKIDHNHAELTGKVDATNKELAEVSKVVHRTDSKLNALFWVIGVLIAAATFLITVGGAAGWFK